jgi:hypothetical protein
MTRLPLSEGRRALGATEAIALPRNCPHQARREHAAVR